MVKKQKLLEDLFHVTLKDIYFAEKKILATLPKMQKAAQSEELAAAFEKHHLLNALTAKRGGSLGWHPPG